MTESRKVCSRYFSSLLFFQSWCVCCVWSWCDCRVWYVDENEHAKSNPDEHAKSNPNGKDQYKKIATEPSNQYYFIYFFFNDKLIVNIRHQRSVSGWWRQTSRTETKPETLIRVGTLIGGLIGIGVIIPSLILESLFCHWPRCHYSVIGLGVVILSLALASLVRLKIII